MAQTTSNTPLSAEEIMGQTRGLVEQAYHWLRYDSLEALIGVGVTVGLFLLMVALRRGTCRLLAHGDLKNGDQSWRGITARVVRRTTSWFLALLSAELVSNAIAPPGALLRTIAVLFTVAAVIQGAIWLRELVLAMIERRALTAHDDHSGLASAMGIIRLFVNIIVWALALILVLDNLGVNVTTLIAGLGIGGIAIGLAAQGIFSDLFAALAILFDRPFRKGDAISVGAVQGTVEAIGLKTTRIRAVSGEQVVVSNTKLLDQEIRNNRLIKERRVVTVLSVVYQTSADMLEAIPGELKRIVDSVRHCRFDRAHLANLNASSIDFELVYQVTTADYGVMMDAKQAVFLKIIRRFAEMGINFAYPSQMSFLGSPDGRIVDPSPSPQAVRADAASSHPQAGEGD